MAVLELPVRSDLPAFSFSQELEGLIYNLSFRFNVRMGQWIMDIANEEETQILAGIPVQSDVDLTSRYNNLPLPPGRFLSLDETGAQRNPDRDTFGKEVKFLYVESTELVA